jgi:hypothetical protein
MPRHFIFKVAFQKAFDKLSEDQQQLTLKALDAIRRYLETGLAAYGLRIKRLYDGGNAKTFEARVTMDLRILWVQTKDEIVFALLGNHNEVRRFLKNL